MVLYKQATCRGGLQIHTLAHAHVQLPHTTNIQSPACLIYFTTHLPNQAQDATYYAEV